MDINELIAVVEDKGFDRLENAAARRALVKEITGIEPRSGVDEDSARIEAIALMGSISERTGIGMTHYVTNGSDDRVASWFYHTTDTGSQPWLHRCVTYNTVLGRVLRNEAMGTDPLYVWVGLKPSDARDFLLAACEEAPHARHVVIADGGAEFDEMRTGRTAARTMCAFGEELRIRLDLDGYRSMIDEDVYDVPDDATPVFAEFRADAEDGGQSAHLPIAFVEGNGAILTMPYSTDSQVPKQIVGLAEMLTVTPVASDDADKVAAANKMLDDLGLINDAYIAASARIRDVRDVLRSARSDVSNYMGRLASAVRNEQAAAADLAALVAGTSGRVKEQVAALATLTETLERMRPVMSVQRNGAAVTVRTHDFSVGGLEVQGGMKVRLDLTAVSFSEGINVCHGHEVEMWHPHVDGYNTVCWGENATNIADAWARRDYTSLMTYIFAWACVFNPESPYYQPELIGYEHDWPYGYDEASGWHAPAATAPTIAADAA